MKQNVDGYSGLVPEMISKSMVDNSEEELLSVNVLPELQNKYQKKKESDRLMSSKFVSILRKAYQRTSIKSLEKVGTSIMMSLQYLVLLLLINILFYKHSWNHLISIGHNCGLN